MVRATKHAPARRTASPSNTSTVADGCALSSMRDRHGYSKFIAVIGKARKITPTTTNVAVRIKEQINATHELLPLLILFGDGGGDIFSVII